MDVRSSSADQGVLGFERLARGSFQSTLEELDTWWCGRLDVGIGHMRSLSGLEKGLGELDKGKAKCW